VSDATRRRPLIFRNAPISPTCPTACASCARHTGRGRATGQYRRGRKPGGANGTEVRNTPRLRTRRASAGSGAPGRSGRRSRTRCIGCRLPRRADVRWPPSTVFAGVALISVAASWRAAAGAGEAGFASRFSSRDMTLRGASRRDPVVSAHRTGRHARTCRSVGQRDQHVSDAIRWCAL
jgi:hypothetical protein